MFYHGGHKDAYGHCQRLPEVGIQDVRYQMLEFVARRLASLNFSRFVLTFLAKRFKLMFLARRFASSIFSSRFVYFTLLARRLASLNCSRFVFF